jgi:transcriptional regulator with XRE-family HTH domain
MEVLQTVLMTAKELARLIAAAGVTRQEFADAVGIHVRHLHRLLSGEREILRTTELAIRAVARDLARRAPRSRFPVILIGAALTALLLGSIPAAAERSCRSYRVGHTVYSKCYGSGGASHAFGHVTACRSYRVGHTVYTKCSR